MPVTQSGEAILKFARDNNWLMLSASEGYVLCVFLTPSGNIVEVYFEKNKNTITVLREYSYKP